MKKWSTVLLAVLALILLLAAVFFTMRTVSDGAPVEESKIVEDENGCEIQREQLIVRGNSLEPFIQSGREITALLGYYSCNEVKRGDVVLYRYAGNKNLLIKIVRGVPGDTFSFFRQDGNLYNLYVNEELVRNSEGIPYRFNDQAFRMLSLYIRDYKGVIPARAYLILGDQPDGSLDSERFGLVDISDISGKVVY